MVKEKFFKQNDEGKPIEISKEDAIGYAIKCGNEKAINLAFEWIIKMKTLMEGLNNNYGYLREIDVICSAEAIEIKNVIDFYINEISLIKVFTVINNKVKYLFGYRINNCEEEFGELNKSILEEYFLNKCNEEKIPEKIQNFIGKLEESNLYKR